MKQLLRWTRTRCGRTTATPDTDVGAPAPIVRGRAQLATDSEYRDAVSFSWAISGDAAAEQKDVAQILPTTQDDKQAPEMAEDAGFDPWNTGCFDATVVPARE